jgi:peptidoglycan/LPS O-acetylase OafA/YrhL
VSQPEIHPLAAAGSRLAWLDALRGIAALYVVFVAALLACCGLTRRFIEGPMQRLGRRVAGRLDARFGPDRPPPRRPRPDPAAAGLADQADGLVIRG